ncbi:MAG: RagB/SusD family nutrient uptake outer membrane protein [Chitinophagales bacterium]|nr:RagB/SusD family nutrient uptake outer membrane protein [Chitinophagales bacterium]
MKKRNIITRNTLKVKNKILLPLFVYIAGILILSSCEKFLSQESITEVAGEDMFTDFESLESARIGLYNSLQDVSYYGSNYILATEAHSDNGAVGGFDYAELEELGNKSLTSSNLIVEDIWIAIYYSIYNANRILGNIDNITDATLSEDLKNDIKGETYAIRALAHFDLLRMFGEHWDINSTYGIPVVTSLLAPDATVSRNTVANTYEAIINDLTEAIILLSDEELRLGDGSYKGAQFITQTNAKAILARVCQYKMDYELAEDYATQVIDAGYSFLSDTGAVENIYTSKLSNEAVFELVFNAQDKSFYNAYTYSRTDALRTEILYLASEDLGIFFGERPDDVRMNLVDYINNDLSITPDGRTQKYRGEAFQDNSAFIIRIAEMYLIRAEAKGYAFDGMSDINTLRANRGLPAAAAVDTEEFLRILIDERRAELNFEGHRYFDLAHFGLVNVVLGDGVLREFPIPLREVNAAGLKQNPGY